jgi:hypothetical protein
MLAVCTPRDIVNSCRGVSRAEGRDEDRDDLFCERRRAALREESRGQRWEERAKVGAESRE